MTGWQSLATTNSETIREWFSNIHKGCNYGVLTGNGLVVVDLDIRSDRDGVAELQRILDQTGITIPQTVQVATEKVLTPQYSQRLTESEIAAFLRGVYSTPQQQARLAATWNRTRTYGDTSNSRYIFDLVRESFHYARQMGMNDVGIDAFVWRAVVSWCERHGLDPMTVASRGRMTSCFRWVRNGSIVTPPHTPTTVIDSDTTVEPYSTKPNSSNNQSVTKNQTPPCETSGIPTVNVSHRSRQTPRKNVYLDALRESKEWVTAADIAATTDTPIKTVRRALDRAVAAGELERRKPGKETQYRIPRSNARTRILRDIPLPTGQWMTRTALTRRGWPATLIDETFGRISSAMKTKLVPKPSSNRMMLCHLYRTDVVRQEEHTGGFEDRRKQHRLRKKQAKTHTARVLAPYERLERKPPETARDASDLPCAQSKRAS